jgi:16S rRNA (uracil1498-N3)-methyltransferase
MIRVLMNGTALDEGEQHHLRVRRAEPGEAVELRDGQGMVGRGRLVREGKSWSVAIEATETLPPPPVLVLAVGAGDRERFGWLVEKAAEIGVTTVVPLECARAAGVGPKLRGEQVERLRRRAVEAVKQSGAAWAPVVEVPTSLEEFAARPFEGQRWLADPAGATPPVTLDGTPVAVAIGPEGGFSNAECEALLAWGFRPVALGPHILRFETAALAAAAAVVTARHRGQQRGHRG